jgi:hypothetical protein
VGVDNVMFETDYPHQDSTWPRSREAAAEQLGHLEQSIVNKVARNNGIQLLGLELPDGPWTTQQARNLLADLGERAATFSYLVRDRAGQFTTAFDAVLADAGVKVPKIPPQCKPIATRNGSSAPSEPNSPTER